MNEPHDGRRDFGIIEAFREPAISTNIFIGIAALIVCHTQMIARFNNEGSLIAMCIAGAGLIFRWTISPVMFLILVTYLLFDPNFQGLLTKQFWNNPYPGDFVSNMLLSASVLVYLVAQYRVLSFVHQSMPTDPPPRRKGQPEPKIPRRPTSHFTERESITAFAIALGAVIVGILAWSLLSSFERAYRPGSGWGIDRPFARLMIFLWAVGTITVLTGVVFRYIALRRMSRPQARLMLQDMFWRETRREQERIHRWRRWARSRKRVDSGVDTPA